MAPAALCQITGAPPSCSVCGLQDEVAEGGSAVTVQVLEGLQVGVPLRRLPMAHHCCSPGTALQHSSALPGQAQRRAVLCQEGRHRGEQCCARGGAEESREEQEGSWHSAVCEQAGVQSRGGLLAQVGVGVLLSW